MRSPPARTSSAPVAAAHPNTRALSGRSSSNSTGASDVAASDPMSSSHDVFDSGAPEIYGIQTRGPGPAGSLPLTEELLLNSPSGDLFGLTQNAGMGWNPAEAGRKQFLILSTQGGLRAPDGHPIALGYHTGHWEIGLLVQAAAEEFRRLKTIPFAAYCSDPCD